MAVSTAPVTVYTTSTCPWCVRAKDFLRQAGVEFQEKNIEQDRAAQMEVYRRTGQLGVPVIADDQEAIIGFNVPQLREMAARHSRPKLGLRVATTAEGVKVGGVREDAVTGRAGVQEGDYVVELSGVPVNTTDDLEKIASRMRQGIPTSMTVKRGDERLTLILRP
jgi:glutaredoxin-like YruB-family protein